MNDPSKLPGPVKVIIGRLLDQRISQDKNIPTPIKLVLGALGGAGLVVTGLLVGSGKWIFVLILGASLALILGGSMLFTAWRRKKQNATLGDELQQHTSASPQGISDPGQRARLDALRKKFESGVHAYRARGKDLYKLPWYVIVGEPGSGKTEAVRHSNVGFPPGMQDEFQGVGGTINMNWWFTNYAVLLDTAGKLMFEEVKPGETSEWKEFLNLLKKNRPNCPVNGLFLVIPADSLIVNSADEISKKAGKIAQQLDGIQRVLDIRFPVFVIVTKCDKLNGFREFFDGLTDPQLQHQMLGWSNPDPLDAPFRPELVDQHLGKVIQRLRRRRLGLLRDPVPEDAGARRADEVDALYALPYSFSLIGSRLRRYLETIFIAGEWSSKPLFLRGIYFTSSMREGSALDQELADAIGVPVDALPEGKVWERERAFFLRDLFVEKVFREKGLVTRATNTRRMMRGRQIALFSCIFLALAAFVTFAWLGSSKLRKSVKNQSDYWTATISGWKNKSWEKAIVNQTGEATFVNGETNMVEVRDKGRSNLGAFHVKLREVVEKPLPRNLLLPRLADDYNRDSQKAQRIVFEGSVIKPLLEAVRSKMKLDQSGDPDSQKRQGEALVALIRLEADILRGNQGTNKGEIDPESAKNFLLPLLSYATGQTTVDTNILTTMAWTYSNNRDTRGKWPPRWLAGTTNPTNNLANNPAILAGLDYFVKSATNSLQDQLGKWNEIAEVRNAARKFLEQESTLFAAAQKPDDETAKSSFAALGVAKKALDDLLDRLMAAVSAATPGSFSLSDAYQKFWVSASNQTAGAFSQVKAANEKARSEFSSVPLFGDIARQLDAVQGALTNRVANLVSATEQAEFRQLDELLLAGQSYKRRWELYQQNEKAWSESLSKPGSVPAGLLEETLGNVLNKNVYALASATSAYAGSRKPELTGICAYFQRRAEGALSDLLLGRYLQERTEELNAQLGFPLIANLNKALDAGGLKKAGETLNYVATDLGSATLQKLRRTNGPQWSRFISTVSNLASVAKSIQGEEGAFGSCTIGLRKMEDSTKPKDGWREHWHDIKLDGPGSKRLKTEFNNADLALGKISMQQKLSISLFENIDATQGENYLSGEWGPLWLIHTYKATKQTDDPKSWLVDWPVNKPYQGDIRLKLTFDRVLPDLGSWPVWPPR